jgi:3-deoxy-7-phosphoheptulonate synthase
MIIVIRPHATKVQIAEVIAEVEKLGYTPAPIHGAAQTVVAAIGDERTHANLESLSALPQVESVLRVQKRFKLTSRESHPQNTLVDVAGVETARGGDNPRNDGTSNLDVDEVSVHDCVPNNHETP